MKRALLFLLIVSLFCTFRAYAQAGFFRNQVRSPYETFKARSLREQADEPVQKAAVIKERLAASSVHYYWTTEIDSNRFKYSGSRGSQLAVIDNAGSQSYYDYAEDAGPSGTLHFDTAYLFELATLPAIPNRRIKKYDAAGYVTELLAKEYDPSTGQPTHSYRELYTYDANHHCIKAIFYQDTSLNLSGAFKVSDIYIAQYTGGFCTMESTYDAWSGTPNRRNYYTYNTAGKIVLQTTQDWDGTTLANNFRLSATYDANNRLKTAQREMWDGVSQFEKSYKDSFGYAGSFGAYVYDLGQRWDNTQGFYNDYLYTASLTSFGAVDSVETASFYGTMYYPQTLYRFFYNASNHLTYSQEYSHGGVITAKQFENRKNYYYESYTDLSAGNVQAKQEAGIILYPNPSNGAAVHLQLSEQPSGEMEISITDLTGRIVQRQEMKAARDITIAVAELPVGCYVVSARWKGQVLVTRLVKEQ